MQSKIKRISLKDFFIVFIPCMIWTILFWNSLVWDYSEFSKRKFVTYFGVTLFVLIISLLASLSKKFVQYREKKEEEIKRVISNIKNNPIKYVIIISIYIGLAIVAGLLSIITYKYKVFSRGGVNGIFLFYLLIEWTFYTIYNCRNICEKKPEFLYFLVAVLLTSFFIFKNFDSFVSWDERFHFENAIQFQRLFTGNDLEADHLYSLSNGQMPLEEVQNIYEKHTTVSNSFVFAYHNIAYLPYYIGFVIARGLSLNVRIVYSISILFQSIFCTFIISRAIKIIPYGKRLLSCVGLAGTLLFLNGSFSYDPWVVAFMVLGFAYFVKNLNANDGTLTLKEATLPLICIFIGCLPKAIYFLLALLGLFIPTKKFKNKSTKRKFIVIVFAVIIILLASFVLPMIFSSASQAGDSRGGTDVSAIGQIKFILSNPIEYTKILFNFMFNSYLPYEVTGSQYLSFFAYLGRVNNFTLPLLTIVVTAFLDRNMTDNKYIAFRIATYIAIFASIILVATALYVSFTPVGYNTVNGCQPRYLLPLLFPFYLLLVPNGKIDINYKKLSLVSVSLMTIHYFYVIFCVVYL
ncbi:DUF2142 domain-containing protein [Lachnospira multipara]|uniref:Predicted membrane protein n=1 Tax=Lachnospira multipara TaxID=28051 RepID=A0A1H5XDB6_9FIRM|nr:DUF2142 domain-containing protein [Lachnospira multipara]SEG09742.1 Predicted membrane protein [Lachnospira multipara]